jgi:hypothetical protein
VVGIESLKEIQGQRVVVSSNSSSIKQLENALKHTFRKSSTS